MIIKEVLGYCLFHNFGKFQIKSFTSLENFKENFHKCENEM